MADPAGGARNNFDLIRLAAALLVLFSHAYVLAGRPEDEPVAALLRHALDGGAFAVAAFFVASGFLIAGSATRHRSAGFAVARALRIVPAFAAVVLLQALLLGPLVSGLGAAAFLADAATWSALARGLLFSPPPGLPGVFTANPLPGVVNGSLWTLRIELACYGGTLLWALLGAPRMLVAAGVLALATALGAAHAADAGLRITSVLDCLLHFATGAAAWCWRDRLGGRALALVAVTGAAAAIAAGGVAGALLWHLALPPLVLGLALHAPVAPFPWDDISYGTYLYAFPVEQLLAAYLPGIAPPGLAALAVPPTLACAVLSRRLVERPALRWKPVRLRPTDLPPPGR